MPFEAVAQSEGVSQPVVGDLPARHLRLDPEVGVHRQQRIVDHVAVVARDVGRGDNGINHAQVRVHDRPDCLGFRPRRHRKRCGDQ